MATTGEAEAQAQELFDADMIRAVERKRHELLSSCALYQMNLLEVADFESHFDIKYQITLSKWVHPVHQKLQFAFSESSIGDLTATLIESAQEHRGRGGQGRLSARCLSLEVEAMGARLQPRTHLVVQAVRRVPPLAVPVLSRTRNFSRAGRQGPAVQAHS